MCNPKPHPRCSAHAETALKNAEDKLEELKRQEDIDEQKLRKATHVFKTARSDFYTTPRGIEQLSFILQNAQHAGNKTAIRQAQQRLLRCKKRRQSLIEQYKQEQSGKLPAARTCLQCGNIRPLQRTKYCSMDCMKKHVAEMHKRSCVECKRTPTETEFGNHPKTFDGLSTICKECNREREQKRNREKTDEQKSADKLRYQSDAVRNTSLKRNFGITLDDYKAMFSNQDGCCKICRKSFNDELVPHVDHDHASGKVRGLLCTFCNRGIGHLKDDVEVIKKALVYVEATKGSSPVTDGLFFRREGEARLDMRNFRHIKSSKEGRQRLLDAQNGCCKICGKDVRGLKFHVDHSHSDGHIRGILCGTCNQGDWAA